MKKPKILALGGSIRSSLRHEKLLLEAVHSSKDVPEFLEKMKTHVASDPRQLHILSNSDILAGVSLMGAKSLGCDVDFYPLLKLFGRREKSLENFAPSDLGLEDEIATTDLLSVDEESLELFRARVRDADGIIFVSPIYFGDRSSVANKFIQLAGKESMIDGKVVSAVSVGAKRNGGQETTNIFFLYEAINLGAFVVGNGPESAQYGGTALAGDKGKVLSDEFGIETTYGAGYRTAQVVRVVKNFPETLKKPDAPVRISVLVTMDTPERKLRSYLTKFFEESGLDPARVDMRLLELIDGDIERCLACSICPIPRFAVKQDGKQEIDYACIIRRSEDSMEDIRDELMNANGVIVAGLNLRDVKDVIYRYQAFVERTRFVRRTDFEWTNIPMTGFLLNEVGAEHNPIHNIKVMTSFIRHNAIMLKPITEHFHRDQIIESGKDALLDFVSTVEKFTCARERTDAIRVSYKAKGYMDKSLDHTAALRK